MALEEITVEYKTNQPTPDYTANKVEPRYHGLQLLEQKRLEGPTGIVYWK